MITQEDIDAMENGMSDLVKRLRDEHQAMTRNEAADRIEQLERELANIKKANTYMDEQHQECRNQLITEKALADRLGKIVVEDFPDGAAAYDYRKSRGL